VLLERLRPYDAIVALLADLSARGVQKLVFCEEGILSGGIAEKFCAALRKRGFRGSFDMVGIDRFVPAATVDEQLAMFGLDKAGMIRRLR
jgi:deoxyxylulose-5-phosphate synthase